jgi:hypothetical protein
MAEEEKIVHHIKEAVHTLTDKKKKGKEKIKDFLLEILIIIVAVSITLWFHNWNDRKTEKEMEKNFLISLRQNLVVNDSTVKFMIHNFSDSMLYYYNDILSQVKNNTVNAKYVDSVSGRLLMYYTRDFNLGLFESFKSAGNLRLIENQQLLSDITYIYSAHLPFRQEWIRKSMDAIYQNFDKYVGVKSGGYEPSLNFVLPLSTYLKDKDVQYFLQVNATYLYWLIENLKETDISVNVLLKEIDTELKNRFDYEVSDKKDKT